MSLPAAVAAIAVAAAVAAAAVAETIDPPGSNTLKKSSAAALRRSRPASVFDESEDTRPVAGSCAHGKGPPGGLRGLPAPLTTTSYLRGRGAQRHRHHILDQICGTEKFA